MPYSPRTRASGYALAVCVSLFLTNCSKSPVAPTQPALRVTSISPALGSTTGGTMVTVIGTEFGPDTALTVGGVTATKVALQGTTSLTATIAAHPATGAGDVVVTSAGQSATLAKAFTFYAPTGGNVPPVVMSARTIGSRPNQPSGFANIDDTVTLVPTVVNAESAATLTYEWRGQGTFTPTTDGTTSWHLPNSASPAPQGLTATLVVTEVFAEGAVTHVQTSTPFDFVLQLHDTKKEVLDMGEDFLTLFTKQVPVDVVLHNFSPTCDRGDGRASEAQDTLNNQQGFIQDFGAFRISRREPFQLVFRTTCFTSDGRPQSNVDACSSFSVHWEGIDKKNNARFIANGVDYVSAVLESNQWRLCHSSFVGTESYPALGITRAVSW